MGKEMGDTVRSAGLWGQQIAAQFCAIVQQPYKEKSQYIAKAKY